MLCRLGEDVINVHVAAATHKGPASLATYQHQAEFDKRWVLLKREIESKQIPIRTRVA